MSLSSSVKRLLVFTVIWLAACNPGGESGDVSTEEDDPGCTGSCADTPTNLTVSDVQQVIAQAVAEAQARGTAATIAVVDREGNVLGVFRINGADRGITITSGRAPAVMGGLEGIAIIPDTLAAIAKAITGAYLSSEGNAFTTRTANQIVQEHFNPGEINQPSGPLFGVQFSQLPCGDLVARFTAVPPDTGVNGNTAPNRSPLGLSADPGGLPLYKNGTPVGGIGVISDGIYGLDLNIGDTDTDNDELIALAGTFGFAVPENRRADRITVDGKSFRFTDRDFDALASAPASAPAFGSLGGTGALQAVAGYTAGAIIPGTAFTQPGSGIRPDSAIGNLYPGRDAFVLVTNVGANAFPPIAGSEAAGGLTAAEVQTILDEALGVANRARAQIRRPLGSQARVTISVVDSNGVILGIARTRDAPMFGTDVSLQKARTAAFFSNANAATDLQAPSVADTVYLNPDGTASGVTINIFNTYVGSNPGGGGVRDFLHDNTALTGLVAFSDRAGGNLSRPYFPDGLVSAPNGPFSKPFDDWSPFTDGLQLDLSMNDIIAHVLFVLGAGGVDNDGNCANTPAAGPSAGRIRNGIQIFPGSVPIYKNGNLVGGIGVSGDGVDQDDMVSFLGLHNAGVALTGTGTGGAGEGVGNAPVGIRADNIIVPSAGVNLRYVQCPQAPFIDSNEQNVCEGK